MKDIYQIDMTICQPWQELESLLETAMLKESTAKGSAWSNIIVAMIDSMKATGFKTRKVEIQQVL